MKSLKDQRVLVIGASRGIGLAIGEACADAGASVVLSAHPTVAFTNYVVGATVTEFGDEAGGAMAYAPEWVQLGYVAVDEILQPIDHGQAIVDLISLPSRVCVDRVSLRVRRPPSAEVGAPLLAQP
jgi:NAD(P)-dependent dehydrogenase (short-subunit alcohol dehydrogenase family)